jgi:hypothetical protein
LDVANQRLRSRKTRNQWNPRKQLNLPEGIPAETEDRRNGTGLNQDGRKMWRTVADDEMMMKLPSSIATTVTDESATTCHVKPTI